MKKILLALIPALSIANLSFASQPIISDMEVERTYLFLEERAGAIDGYLIFYDKKGRQRAVKGTTSMPLEDI
ncbi:MAG: hypothetical protein ISS26_01775 [Candidatus Omnitrophica bacterium]|nr:hypothetical protein [Candidatus Omnitrophota bacterium]